MTKTLPSRDNTRILNCSCASQFQDERYGCGLRLHNRMKQTDPAKQLWRCTVCLNIHSTARKEESKPEPEPLKSKR